MADCPAIQIENAMVELILLCDIPDISAANVFAREQPEILEKDPKVGIIVVVGNERLAKKDPRSNSSQRFEYPGLVILFKKTALTQPKSDPWKKNARWAIRKMLFRSLLLGKEGVVRRVEYNPEPEFNAIGYAQGFKYSAQLFLYGTEEDRDA